MDKKIEVQKLIQRRSELSYEIKEINLKISQLKYAKDAKFLKREFADGVEFIKRIDKLNYLSVSDDGIFERHIYDLSDYDIINEDEYNDFFDKIVNTFKKY